MKVCHITSSHNRYDSRIFEKECISLAKKYDVYLLCSDNKKNEIKNGVNIISTGFQPMSKKERFFKSVNLIEKKLRMIDADIYHFHDPELINLAAKFKKQNKIVIFDSHEDNVNRIRDREWIPRCMRNIVLKAYELFERKKLCNIDAVITVTDHIYERLMKINKNTHIITNYPIIDYKNKNNNTKKENIICFAGGISKQYMHHNIIKAISNIDTIKYKVAGKYVDSYFNSLKLIDGYEKVEYLGILSKEEVKTLYSKSQIGMVLIDYTPNVNHKQGSRGVIKIFEYMESSIPVICTNLYLWEQMMNEKKFGICVNPNNVDEIRNAILYLINNPDEAKKMGENGRKLVEEKYNWGTQEKILLDLYKELEKKLK